jgi:hypothetical protein
MQWDELVKAREGFSGNEMKKMTLSQESLQGLRMTSTNVIICSMYMVFIIVYVFVDKSKYLLSNHEDLFILSERFNQDPLESFFGQQWAIRVS